MPQRSEPYDIDLIELLGPFSDLEDPHKSPATRHLFEKMLFIALATALAGAEGFVDMVNFAKSRLSPFV